MILVIALELMHVTAAICKIPLYTRVEQNARYMYGVKKLTATKITFTYIFAWIGIFFAILNLYIMNYLVHACQELHSNVHLVLGYD